MQFEGQIMNQTLENGKKRNFGPDFGPNFGFYLNYNSSQNISHKLKKYRKIGQDFKNVISNFVCFLAAIVSV